ncbi:hypothetical protein [Flavobacterium piscis]|uniref:Lipoprotein n=1 Tax=Flavobacterium piscis TaxID=1114874 RepID=A0ABU1Y611_9FLAO|nr:hypothetical protein [Flavobacterium piscis]MDR7209662.1 hypothetical protein [Flavobacterium piscis]
MNYIKPLIILSFFCLISCNFSEREKKTEQVYWDDIEINTKTQKVIIYKESDTASFETAIYKKTSGNGILAKYRLDTIQRKTFSLTASERDSIYKYTYQIITKPVFTDKYVTCYGGYVLIKLRDRQTTLMCEYKSVGEWSTVSKETKKIYDILSSKINIAKQ